MEYAAASALNAEVQQVRAGSFSSRRTFRKPPPYLTGEPAVADLMSDPLTQMVARADGLEIYDVHRVVQRYLEWRKYGRAM